MKLGEKRIMWFLVLFDLPTKTKRERFLYTIFRKMLLTQGFSMIQYSVYAKAVPNKEFTKKYEEKVKIFTPPGGFVRTMIISDSQFLRSKSYYGEDTGYVKECEIEKPKEDIICLF